MKGALEAMSALFDKAEEHYGKGKAMLMAMGDGNNDIGLMKAAGLSVAMGNSDPEILSEADHVTEDNEHDGVAAAIRKYAL